MNISEYFPEHFPEYSRNFRIFLYLIHSGFSHAPNPDTLAADIRQLSKRKMGFLTMPNFKVFIISKKDNYILKLDVSIPVPNFDTIWNKLHSVYR